jgi:aspartyl protease family protein
MFEQTAKMALALGLLALLFVAAAQNHWFARGGGALETIMAPRDRAMSAAPDPISQSATAPASAPRSHALPGVVELAPDGNAQYQTEMEIDGASIPALVDTGATYVVLSAEDARTLDIDPPSSNFTVKAHTANGTAMLAPVRLREVRVGEIEVYDVQALVAKPGQTAMSLLGMSFLKKLSSFQVADGRFVMKQ